ncbi:hypothetical protein BH24ACI3_BH24ACI3_06460 [soil metagenome]
MDTQAKQKTSQRSSLIGIITRLAAVVVGFAIVAGLSTFTDARRVTLPESYADADLSLQGGRLKGWALGAEGLIADWYWMWSLQYIGEKIIAGTDEEINLEDLRSLDPRLLYPMLDAATDLDPKFMAAYSYGASVLPAIDPSLAVKLTEKGIVNNPEAWRLYQYLGYIYWRTKQFDKAAETYEKGSQIKGAAPFMREMVAAMNTQGGSRDTAREMYQQMLAEAEDQQSRSNAELRLMEIDALDEQDAINDVLEEMKTRFGECPSSISAIIPTLRNVKLPRGRDFSVDASGRLVDPLGFPYLLNESACRVGLNNESKIPRSL